MNSSTTAPWKAEPFRHLAPADFARLRELLVRHEYTEPALCARLEIESIYRFVQLRDGRAAHATPADAQMLLTNLFLDAEEVPWTVVRALLPADDIALLESFDLIESVPSDESLCAGSVLLYPTERLYVASDRNVDPEHMRLAPPVDVVYPAITRNTERFVRLMPRSRCERFLELCSGTGIAALIAGHEFADAAWAIDITGRATLFARFNAALNGLENVTALEGDLFEPVRGQTFDRIVAHPPYMPALEDKYIFRDGGEDGERVTWSIFRDLPAYLRPGGEFYCDCLATDRTGAPVEQRIREALGEHGGEFDILFAQAQRFDPVAYYADLAKEGRGTFESVGHRWEAFKRLQIEALVFGSILLRRRADSRAGIVVRRHLAPDTTMADFRRLLDWESATAGWGAPERRALLDARLRVNPQTRVRAIHELQGGQWQVTATMLATPGPFANEATCPLWFPQLLAWLDGEMRGRDHLQHLKDTGMVPREASDDEFAAMLQQLVDGGFATLVRQTAD